MQWAKDNFIPYVYIGATNETKGMKYKRYYSGLETIVNGTWVNFDPNTHTQGHEHRPMLRAEGFNI